MEITGEMTGIVVLLGLALAYLAVEVGLARFLRRCLLLDPQPARRRFAADIRRWLDSHRR